MMTTKKALECEYRLGYKDGLVDQMSVCKALLDKNAEDRKSLLKEIAKLYGEIDVCITDLVDARLAHDTEKEGKALFTMEGLMVGTQQDLTCVIDYLTEEELGDEARD